ASGKGGGGLRSWREIGSGCRGSERESVRRERWTKSRMTWRHFPPQSLMTTRGDAAARGRPRRVLFIQATEPAGYPPLIHASSLMADAGWEVTFLSAPFDGMTLVLDSHPRIAVHAIASRPSHVFRKAAYARYLVSAAALAWR